MSQPRYPRHELATSPVGDDVVLLDEQERPIGRADRLRVHTDATPLPLGLLHLPVQRPGRGAGDPARALAKSTWPGVWTNSACGHPRPGEGIEAAARRRIREELGLVVGPLIPLLPDFRYRATDASGIVENEVCPVYAGFVADEDPRPDAAEVADWAWVPWESLTAAITATPDVYSPWAARQVPLMMAAMASKTSFGHHQSPDPDAARRDVDSLLEDKLSALAEDWEEFSAGLGVDVLRHDLPGWRGLLIGRGKRVRTTLAYWLHRLAVGVTAPDKHTIVVGDGLSGLAAALDLAEAGHRVTVVERESFPGGRNGTLRVIGSNSTPHPRCSRWSRSWRRRSGRSVAPSGTTSPCRCSTPPATPSSPTDRACWCAPATRRCVKSSRRRAAEGRKGVRRLRRVAATAERRGAAPLHRHQLQLPAGSLPLNPRGSPAVAVGGLQAPGS